ncbi:unnamed protein product [Diamesa serratosioi]
MNFSAHQKQMNLLEASQSPIHSPGGSFLSRQRTTSSTNQDFNNATANNNNNQSGSHFFEDISSMMRGFGDAEDQKKESVILVEKIVLQQMRGLSNEVLTISHKRGSASPTQHDFEFLMRRNPVKVQRLRKYLKNLNLFKTKQGKLLKVLADQKQEDTSDEDETKEKFDEEKTRRLFRGDQISKVLNIQAYQKYCEARNKSFICRNSNTTISKMAEWLSVPQEVRQGVNLDILSFLIHETIGTIVDYAILTRLNSENRSTDPFGRMTSGSSYSMMHLCPEVTQGRGLDGVKSITVQEINEAIRRHTEMMRRKMGTYRNCSQFKIPFLAL